MNITRENLRNFKADFMNAIKCLEEKYDVSIDAGKISYDEEHFTMKLEVKNEGAEERQMEKLFEYYPQYKNLYKKKFNQNGRIYKVVGFKPSNKYSVECERDDGARYSFTMSAFNNLTLFD